MISAFNVSVSGLFAASRRIAVSADNIANQHSTSRKEGGQTVNEPYHAKVAQSVSKAQGGVSVVVNDATPPTITIFNPGAANADANGQSEVPNVDVAEQLINQQIAGYDYRANLKAIQAQNHLFENLLDIKS